MDPRDTPKTTGHDTAMRLLASRTLPTLTNEEVKQLLAAPSPLGFWRRYRGMTLEQLASAIGIDPVTLEQAENGSADLPADTTRKAREALRLPP